MRFWKNVWVLCFRQKLKKWCLEKSSFAQIQIPLVAIHKIISHIWEDGSRTVNNNEPDLRFFTETFDLLSAKPFENLVFRPQSQGGQICVSWAHPLGPGLGPPTWAQLGPTHLDFQTPPPAPRDEFSNPDPGPSQRTQG